MLFAVADEQAGELIRRLEERKVRATAIGYMAKFDGKSIRVEM
ncbi:MAG: hypothetical protein Q4D04_09575 [Clostridia bacterium]|nr:hypothetical protein [Clostridia bacterium]